MRIKKTNNLTQPIVAGVLVFIGAFVLSAFASHSFTPVGDSSALDSEINVEIEPSLSLAIMDKDPSNLSNGEVASTIGTMSMEVTPNASGVFISSTAYVVAGSNNETGYTLSFSDTDNNTALTNTDPAVTTNIPSISSASSSLTDIATNQWGYAFNTDTVFSPIPALSSPVTLASTTVPSSSVYPFTAASKIDMNIPAGTYQDSVMFSLVANFVPTPHAISFNANSSSYNPATAVTGTMPESIDLKYNRTITLPDSTTATRLGYRFLGWDEDEEATAPTYQAGDIVDYADLSGDTVTMYAIWQPKNFPTSLTAMQGMTSDICADVYTPTANSTTIEAIKADGSNYYYSADNVAQTTLYDVRGKNSAGTIANPASGSNTQTYVVRKLADGNCWMVQNLNLNLSTSVSLNSTTSDLTEGRSWTPENNTQTTEGIIWAQDGSDGARSFEPGEAMYFAEGIGTGSLDDDTFGSSYNYSGYLSSGADYWHVGNYYNWYAATAGTGLSTTAADNIVTIVPDSICPRNWKLPDNAGAKSFVSLLFTTYSLADSDIDSSNKILAVPLNFVRSGYYTWKEARVRRRGDYGYWWTTTTSTAFYAHDLDTGSLRVAPQDSDYKGYGFSTRCVAR